jgi:Ala-tRNA(Pro) deacylase
VAASPPAAHSAAPAARPAARSVDFLGWLRQQGVKFDIKRHAEAFTAQEVAAAVKVTGYELAKVVVLKGDGDYVLAVVPAPLKVDLKAARGILGAKKLSLAHEEEFETLFPGCDRGAMPPFGNLWGVRTFVDESLARHPHIVFNAGSHIETVSMSYTDYERLARPTRARIAEPPAP